MKFMVCIKVVTIISYLGLSSVNEEQEQLRRKNVSRAKGSPQTKKKKNEG